MIVGGEVNQQQINQIVAALTRYYTPEQSTALMATAFWALYLTTGLPFYPTIRRYDG